MAELKPNPTLPDYQQYIKQVCKERDWDKNNPLEIFLLFSEEVGELAKAIRNRLKLYHEEGKNIKNDELGHELADIFNYLLDIANCFNIDLENAVKEKEKLNAARKWKHK
jgi:NTP pyrophosphatase (non-canonical NTP hydrolase)